MEFEEILEQVITLLQRQGRVSYGALKRRFKLDDDYLEDLKIELIEAQRRAVDENERILVWIGDQGTAPLPALQPVKDTNQAPVSYTPLHLAEKILTSRAALEGERKQVTVLFADIKDSTELIRDLDPEAAQQLLDPALHRMMEAVHRFEGTVNQVLGDGIMALFGAPIAHEDHALRACYAALAMQATMRDYTEEVRRARGLELRIRVGLNAGEVVVRAIGNDLHMDYSAVGQATHLAARMEQLATPGTVRLTATTLRLVEGLVRVNALEPIPVKGLDEPVEVFELVGATAVRQRFQARAAQGLTRFVGRQRELDTLQQALAQAGTGHGQLVALVGEAGVGKSRLVYEFAHSHHTQGWQVLESASVSYGKATPYFPVLELLKRYCHLEDHDDHRTIRARVTGQVLTLDEALQDTTPALLALLDALPADSPFLTLDPPQRRQRTLDALKRVLLRESQVQPLVLVFEDLHWIDAVLQMHSTLSIGTAYVTMGHYRRAADSFRRTMEALQGDLLPQRLGTPIVPAVSSRVWLVWSLAELGKFAEGIAPGEEAIQMAEAAGHPYSLINACFALGLLHLRKGDLDRAITVLEQGLGVCQAWGFQTLSFHGVASFLGAAYVLAGRVAEALPLLERVVKQTDAMGIVFDHVLGVIPLGEGYLRAGRIEDALHQARHAVEVCRQHQQRGHEAWALRLLGEIAAHRKPPEVEEAETHYRQALALAEELGMRPLQAHCHLGLGTLYAQIRRGEQARAALTAAIDLYRAMSMTFWLPQAEAALAQHV